MTKIPITILLVSLAACAVERSEPAAQPASSSARAEATAQVASSSTSSTTRTTIDTQRLPDGFVRDSGGFIHPQGWSHTDSLIGEFMRFSQRFDPDSATTTSDTLSFPGGARIGRTNTAALLVLLGEPDKETPENGTLLLQYNSPFIGPDEAVVLHMRADTLRRVSWMLYSD